jgi:hypothetical protein
MKIIYFGGPNLDNPHDQLFLLQLFLAIALKAIDSPLWKPCLLPMNLGKKKKKSHLHGHVI